METLLSLVILIALGYLAAYQFRIFFRRWRGLDQFTTSGFLFIFLGAFFGPHFLNVLSLAVVRQLDPFIYLGLGWIGFIMGIQFEARLLKLVPRKLFFLAQTESLVSSLILFAGFFVLLKWIAGFVPVQSFEVWTGALILTVCGAVSSSLAIRYHLRNAPQNAKILRPLEYIVSLHIFFPLIGLACLYSFFHIDQAGGARITGPAWAGIHLGAGVLLGFLMFLLLRPRLTENERLLLVLGGISLSAGAAGYLHISPVVVCFIAGIVFANMPGFNNLLMEAVLRHAERPVYFMMLILAGSLWDFRSLPGWLFLCGYIAIRFAAKGIAFFALSKAEPSLDWRFPLLGGLLAQGPLAIALIIGYGQRYASGVLPWIVTAILAGAIVNELLAGKFLRKLKTRP